MRTTRVMVSSNTSVVVQGDAYSGWRITEGAMKAVEIGVVSWDEGT